MSFTLILRYVVFLLCDMWPLCNSLLLKVLYVTTCDLTILILLSLTTCVLYMEQRRF